MCHFEYVSKETLKPFKNEIDELIRLVQNDIRDKFTFQYKFIGSVARNMVTHDPKSKILHSCDFAIVHDYGNDEQEYIRFNKKQNSYSWEAQSKGFYKLPDKIDFCKNNNLWQAVRDLYLEKKNHNLDSSKKSRSIFAETIHQICQQNE